MASKSSSGPGRAQRKGRSAAGRAGSKGAPAIKGAPATKREPSKGSSPKGGSRVGRYTPPEVSGRYTPPTPRKVRRSPAWHGVAILVLLILGLLMILLNYLSVLPGSVSGWYLVGGLGLLLGGFLVATRYR
jgi:Cell division protein CrgA